jgi:phosphoglycolate phosphatase-like HAD superfamily hydrolase
MLEAKRIILDFDGTICNLIVDWAALKAKVYKTFQHSYDFKSEKLLEMVKLVYNNIEDKNKLIEIIRSFEQPSGRALYNQVNLKLLNQCSEFAIISNNLTDTVIMVLEEQSLLSRCRAVIGIDKVKKPKPSIAPFDQLQYLWGGIKTSDCLYIGDSETDRLFALNCNIKFLNVKDI